MHPLSRCAGVSCVVRMKGTPGENNASSWADVQQRQCGDAGDRSRACHTATLPALAPCSAANQPRAWNRSAAHMHIAKIQGPPPLSSTPQGVARMAYLISRDADQTDDERERERGERMHDQRPRQNATTPPFLPALWRRDSARCLEPTWAEKLAAAWSTGTLPGTRQGRAGVMRCCCASDTAMSQRLMLLLK